MTSSEQFQDLPLEEVIGDRFGRYSKYIIQDRALPDARDGLKPVQRRILYAMLRDGNTHEKAFRKSAKTVGNVIANYHPHGDISVYDAMVRMSQHWKLRHELVEMQGNNGSVDGDGAAAMRYTEARLSSISQQLLKDIEKETVDFIYNFDDSDQEPTVLPAHYPNLLVNGSTGISAGYATDIPPHALHEAIDAVLMRLDNPEATVPELMTVIHGPDFPTGAIIQGEEGIRQAYETGRGRIIVRAKSVIEPLKAGKSQIVITEIPYDVNKANLVKKIDEVRIDKKLEGVAEVRDESDRTGDRIVIELKKDVDGEGILNYFLKNTDLQITYNFNMVAIHNRRPTLMSLPMLLDAYIAHQKDVVTRRTTFDIKKANQRLHIVEGLIKALSILDQVIATIRGSKDKGDAKRNIIEAYQFTEAQAEAIVSLQLYRLTNTDVTQLREEEQKLREWVAQLNLILSSEKKLVQTIQRELKEVRKQYAEERRSQIEAKVQTIEVDLDILVPSEEVVVSVTKDGYIKRTSMRSYSASNGEGMDMKETDYPQFIENLNTQHHLLLFTSQGNYIYQPVHELPDIRWRDLGQHISSIISLDSEESIVGVIGVPSFDSDQVIVTTSSNGNIKMSALKDFAVARYNRSYKAMNVKKGETLTAVALADLTDDVLLVSKEGMSLRFPLDTLVVTGIRTAGVKGINLKANDELLHAVVIQPEENRSVVVVTQRGNVKRLKIDDFAVSNRALVGTALIKKLKTNAHEIVAVYLVALDQVIYVMDGQQEVHELAVNSLRVADLASTGSGLWNEKERGATSGSYRGTNLLDKDKN